MVDNVFYHNYLNSKVHGFCIETKQSQRENNPAGVFRFSSLLFYTEEERGCFLESSDSEISKLVPNVVPESPKKSTKYEVESSVKSVIMLEHSKRQE